MLSAADRRISQGVVHVALHLKLSLKALPRMAHYRRSEAGYGRRSG